MSQKTNFILITQDTLIVLHRRNNFPDCGKTGFVFTLNDQHTFWSLGDDGEQCRSKDELEHGPTSQSGTWMITLCFCRSDWIFDPFFPMIAPASRLQTRNRASNLWAGLFSLMDSPTNERMNEKLVWSVARTKRANRRNTTQVQWHRNHFHWPFGNPITKQNGDIFLQFRSACVPMMTMKSILSIVMPTAANVNETKGKGTMMKIVIWSYPLQIDGYLIWSDLMATHSIQVERQWHFPSI